MNVGTVASVREDLQSTAFRGEIGFLVQSDGKCGLCQPKQVPGHLVAVVYRIAASHVPIYRCAHHQLQPIDLEQRQ